MWLVLAVSLVLLWDNWQVYNGGTSMFFRSSGTASKKVTRSARKRAEERVAAATMQAVEPKRKHLKTEIIQITTDVAKIDIDTDGGVIKRLELLKHLDAADKTKQVILFDTQAPRTYLAQTGLIGGNYPNHKTSYHATPGPRSTDSSDEIQLVLEAREGGVDLKKIFTFKKDSYVIGVRHEVKNLSKKPIEPSLYLQIVRDGSKPEGISKWVMSTFTGPAVYTDAEKFEKLDFEKIAEGKADHAKKSDNGWIAMVQHHFVSAFIPPDKAERQIYSRTIDENLFAIGNILPLGTIAPGQTVSLDARLLSGPQDSAMLEKTAPGLDLVKDYGLVTIVAKPIFWLMQTIHKFVGNWGWTIILLTVFIKALFYPLAAASYRSMGKMKEFAPKMKEIQDRYKDDKELKTKYTMELYKEEKINPLGGCLPMVIQIPVFIALYWVLMASVEIRNQPWLGWITDLSVKDPYYILPLIMAASMYFQQKMSPPPADPMQAKIMLFMPMIFSIMFFFFPSGLVLYWIVNNVLSITQQWWVERQMKAKKAAKAAAT